MFLVENAITAVFNDLLVLYLAQYAKTSIYFIVTQKSLAVICPSFLLLIESRFIFLKALYYHLLKETEYAKY